MFSNLINATLGLALLLSSYPSTIEMPYWSFKDVETSRGLNYHYYYSPAQAGQRTLVFLHGFPSTANDWHNQVTFFKDQGYGIVVPDMLGYGYTAKPTSSAAYAPSLIAKDIVDILDKEKVSRAVAISHDWGSKIGSRLESYYPDRFTAYAFFAVGYQPPRPALDYEATMALTESIFGYPLYGYWDFFANVPGAAALVKQNWDSAYSAMFPADPELWKQVIGPRGALEAFVKKNTKVPTAPFISDTDWLVKTALLQKGGFEGPFKWYSVMVDGTNNADDAQIPLSNYNITKPVFFGAATKDAISVAALGKGDHNNFCPNSTIKDYAGDHWILFSHADAINQDLSAWLKTL